MFLVESIAFCRRQHFVESAEKPLPLVASILFSRQTKHCLVSKALPLVEDAISNSVGEGQGDMPWPHDMRAAVLSLEV